jgi:hypothetical protein
MRFILVFAPVIVLACGCAGSGLSSSSGPQVRALNVVPAYSSVNVTDGTTTLVADLLFATESGNTRYPYTTGLSGSEPISFVSGATTFATVTADLTNSQTINAIASNSSAGSVILLEDDTSIPTDSEVRLVNASSLGSVDFVFTLSGGTALAPFTVGQGAVYPAQPALPGFKYQVVTSGSYKIQVYPKGQESTTTPIIDGTISVPVGKRWTLVLADSPNGDGQGVLVQVQDNQQLNVD